MKTSEKMQAYYDVAMRFDGVVHISGAECLILIDRVVRLEEGVGYSLQVFTNMGMDDTTDYIEEEYLTDQPSEESK